MQSRFPDGDDELFTPPGNTWTPVSEKLRVLTRVWILGATVLVMAGGLVVGSLTALNWLAAIIVGGAAVGAGWGWWWAAREQRAWGYAERDDDLYITSGIMWRRLVVVPYGRMQYVDVKAGPLERWLGIATVKLHTASPATSASIPGLDRAEAARLRNSLTELGESRAAGL
jgi:membrane protein YdbS with pleckstrin-like domain